MFTFDKFSKIAFLTGSFLFVQNVSAQDATPSAYQTGVPVNYIRTWDANAPIQRADTLMNRPLKDVKQVTQYLDGLGRPLQAVAKQASLPTGGTAKDLVTAHIFDAFGREQKNYLPFSDSGSSGYFKTNPFQQQATFIGQQFSGENWYYNKNNYEPSPASRISKSMPAGNSWVGSDRGISIEYWNNDAGDSFLKNWYIALSADSMPRILGGYDAGQLHKKKTIDEHSNVVIEYTDKSGNTVLKSVGKNTDWLITAYIYDIYGNLRVVIPPKAMQALSGASWTMTQQIMDELCFKYVYDDDNRMIIKKVPGAGELHMVYDLADRIIMTQDANMRASSQWLVTKYDVLGRMEKTALITSSSNRQTHQSNANGSSTYPTVSSGDLLTQTFYDEYSGLISDGSPFGSSRNNTNDSYLSMTVGVFPYPQNLTQASSTRGMVTGIKTKVLGSTQFLYTVNYYDVEGRIIQSRSQTLDNCSTTATIKYGFASQVLIKHEEINKCGSTTQKILTTNKVSYDDLLRQSAVKKAVKYVRGSAEIDKPEQEIVKFEYDRLGQLSKKKLAPAYASNSGLDSLTYEYNIRGWLLGVNRSYLTGGNTNKFGFELGYDKANSTMGGGNLGFSALQYNGNIAGMIWRNASDGVQRKYDFSYDSWNRLTGADFNQFKGSTFNKNDNIDYSVSNLTYDANGNISTMVQKGWKASSSISIDSLAYNYIANSNKLLNVTDNANDAQTKLGDFRTSSLHPAGSSKTSATVDYTYDENGNLVKDLNKDIGDANSSGITYNHLNLPEVITFKKAGGAVKGTITYTYDAAGNKLKKLVQEDGRPSQSTLYVSNAVFQNDSLQFVVHEEGRIRFAEATAATCSSQAARLFFDYFIKDHLGNVRMVLTEQQEDICFISATSEESSWQTEALIYDIEDNRRTETSTVSGASSHSSLGQRVYKTNGSVDGQETGLGIVLKVMAGDKIKISGESYYNLPGGDPGSPVNLAVMDLLSALIGSPGMPTKGLTASDINSIGNNGSEILSTISFSPPPSTAKASISYMVFDEQFKNVEGGRDWVASGSGSLHKLHTQFINNPITITKSGYIYIYVSNQSNLNVYFDNLSVTHTPGPILETTDYYPFGLTMAGISSIALNNSPENKYKFNKGSELQNKEFLDGSGLEFYSTPLRTLDPQIGRWHQIDSKPDYAHSLYSSMGNNPILYNDPLGDTTIPGAGFLRNFWEGAKDGGSSTVDFVKSLGTAQGWKNVGNGLVDLAERGSPASVNGMIKNAQTADAVGNYVSNIPNMTKDQIGHDLGYGFEKTVEVVAVSKGVGIVKNAVNAARSAELGNTMGTLREASQGLGDFSLGEATARTSNKIGKIWAGEGATIASDGKTLVSADRLKQYRPPSAKSSPYATTGVQSNFQSRASTSTGFTSNGHINITHSKPFWQFW